jgi:multiple sugar transport system substrate-binding protein
MRPTTRRATLAVAGIAAVALFVGACGNGGSSGGTSGTPAASGGADTGVKLTMWVRSGGPDDDAQLLAEAYNASHQNQMEVTVIPSDQYLQKVGAAAGQKALPDVLSSDVVYAANYTRQGIFTDITDRLAELDFADDLAQAHIQAATYDGKQYAVPFVVDSSFMFYNKDLFEKAGLDPDNPPRSYDDIYAAAKAITGVEDGVYGFGFDGNCAGCFAYTVFPNAVAGGHPPISLDGATADFDNSAMSDILGLYQKLYADGLVDPAAKAADGSSWNGAFLQGKVGILPNGTYTIPALADADFDWGYIPLGDAAGSKAATFVGGDVIGISSSTKNVDAAWDFMSWTMSDEAQVEVVVKNGGLPVRTDLGDNKYTTDQRIKDIVAGMADGYTPSTPAYGAAINDGNGPWLQALRGVIFGDDPAGALAEGQQAIQALIDDAG